MSDETGTPERLDSLFDPGRATESGSLRNAEYWWYVARRRLLQRVLEPWVRQGSAILEVGSADGPSVGWLAQLGWRTPTDIDPRGLCAGGVCASVTDLPFVDSAFDVVAAFDVIEHVADEGRALAEVRRVLTPAGRVLVSVPAYQWAWTTADVAAGHHRRYTRERLERALVDGGFAVDRMTHVFAGTMPFFALDRVLARLRRRDPERVVDSTMPRWQQDLLLGLSKVEGRVVGRRDLPFGSSVVAVATRL